MPGRDEYGRESASREKRHEQEWRVQHGAVENTAPKSLSPIETILKQAGMRPSEIEETATMIVKSIEQMGVRAPPPQQEKTVGMCIGSVGTPEVIRAVTNLAVEEVRAKQAFTVAPKEAPQTMRATGYKIGQKP